MLENGILIVCFIGDKTLLQSLVLDAMVTEGLERHTVRPQDKQ